MILRGFIWLKYKIYANTPFFIWNFFAKKISRIRAYQYRERKKSFGPLNSSEIIYVIRRRPPAWGLFSNILFVCQGLIYAKKFGFTPVVDMENYWVRELSSFKSINNSHNAWCYFFKQTSHHNLKEVYQSKNVILSDASSPLGRSHPLVLKNQNLLIDPKVLSEFRQIIKSNIELNHQTQNFVERASRSIKLDPMRTMGIFIRGSSYFNNFTEANFSTPDFDFFTKVVVKALKNNEASNIFLVTEDLRISKLFREKFINYEFLDSLRFNANLTIQEWQKEQDHTWDGGLKNMGYDRSLIYLTEIYLLSKLKNFIGTFSNATAFVLGVSGFVDKNYTFVLKDKVLNVN